LLNKSISECLSLLVLALGVAVVQLSSIEKVEASDENEHADADGQQQLIGLLAVFLFLPRGLRRVL
jgi:hypothetical protein